MASYLTSTATYITTYAEVEAKMAIKYEKHQRQAI